MHNRLYLKDVMIASDTSEFFIIVTIYFERSDSYNK